MRAVLDINIIVSALNFAGLEREVIELARRGSFDTFLSPYILDEVSGVLLTKFGWQEEMCHRAVLGLQAFATIVDQVITVTIVSRKDADNKVLACAVAAQADYLVTGDRRDLLPLGKYEGVAIVTSSQFLKILGAEHSGNQ